MSTVDAKNKVGRQQNKIINLNLDDGKDNDNGNQQEEGCNLKSICKFCLKIFKMKQKYGITHDHPQSLTLGHRVTLLPS